MELTSIHKHVIYNENEYIMSAFMLARSIQFMR